jgi:hypothetical protein
MKNSIKEVKDNILRPPVDQKPKDLVESAVFFQENKLFQSYIEFFKQKHWIDSYFIQQAPRLTTLRLLMGGPCKRNSSRTHKKITEGLWIGIEVHSHPQSTNVGIDLEKAAPENYDWIRFDSVRVQMGLLPMVTPKELITHWSAREACFKADSNFSETNLFTHEHYNHVSDSFNLMHFNFIDKQTLETDQRIVEKLTFQKKDNLGDQYYNSYAIWVGDWIFSIAKRVDHTAPSIIKKQGIFHEQR